MALARRIWIAALVLAAAGVVAVGAWLWPLAETTPPTITLEPALDYLPAHANLRVKVRDEGTGLREVVVAISQGGRSRILASRRLPPRHLLEKGPEELEVSLELSPGQLGLAQGPAMLIVTARDRALYNWGEGNIARVERRVVVDTIAPRLAVSPGVIYMSRGGSGAVFYTCDKEAVASGVQLGGYRFLGRSWSGKGRLRVCLFAWPLGLEPGAKAWVWAADAAGNTTRVPLAVRLRSSGAPVFKIRLNDALIARLVGRMARELPSELSSGGPRAFKWINEQLRKANHAKIRAIASRRPTPRQWSQPLLRPPGATTAVFGERRIYTYRGQVLTRSVHLGVDLAHTTHCKVKAAAEGTVIFAGPLGIYGNCVMVDHGLGLVTLYGHLWQISVRKGEHVARGQVIGRSDSTGLALGDHLHFSVLVGGVFVNPKEWWDPMWMRVHLLEPGRGE